MLRASFDKLRVCSVLDTGPNGATQGIVSNCLEHDLFSLCVLSGDLS